MAIKSRSQLNYCQVVDTFIPHWQLAEDAHGSPIVFGGFGLAELQDQQAELEAQLGVQVAAENDRQIASHALELAKASMLERLRQFKHMVRALHPGSTEANVLPTLPALGARYDDWHKAMLNVAVLWGMVNAVEELRLSGNYKLEEFVADQESLLGLFQARGAAENALQRAQFRREEIWQFIYSRLLLYRRVVQGLFVPGTPVFESLPRFTGRRGPTPQPVVVTGKWDGLRQKAVISFSPSDNPRLSRYELRVSTGPKARGKDEKTVGSLAAGASPTEFLSDVGLAQVGDRAHFRVVVILKDGARRGSKAVTAVRV